MRITNITKEHEWEHIACTSKPNRCWYASVDEAGLIIIEAENRNGKPTGFVSSVMIATQVKKL